MYLWKRSLQIFVSLACAFGLLAWLLQWPSSTGDNSGVELAHASLYPLQTEESFSYWTLISSNVRLLYSGIHETPYAREVEKRTGVKVNWVHPAGLNHLAEFNRLLTRGDLPDAIEYNWVKSYPGGPEKALSDGVIIELNDLIEQHAPNLRRLLAEQPELRKMVVTDSGKMYVFPMIRSPELLVYKGLMLRKDWLDEAGLAVPETIADWEQVLAAFQQRGAEAPLTLLRNVRGLEMDAIFFSAYGVADSFYIDNDGKVRYGPAEPAFKQGLELLAEWYRRGWIDRDIALNDTNAIDHKMLNGTSGAVLYLLNNGIHRYLEMMKGKKGTFDLVAAPYPVLNRGEIPFTGHRDFQYLPDYSAAITSSAKNPELIVKWLDFFYSDEGTMLSNYGIEGVTYRWADGKVQYMDWLDQDPQWTRIHLLSGYIRGNAPTVVDTRYTPLPAYEQVRDALEIWSATGAAERKLPPFLTPTLDEAQTLARSLPAITALGEEMRIKLIMGVEGVERHAQYVARMQELGLERVLDIYQSALRRYEQR